MASDLEVLLYDITGKLHGYTNENITDYQFNEILGDYHQSYYPEHSHVFQNMPGTDDYDPVYVYGLNTKYLQHLLRLQCEKPIVFTSDMHDKQVICHPGQEVCVQNTGPYPIRNSARVTVVPPLTKIHSKLSDKNKTLLQTVEWETYNQNLWDLIVFLQSLLTTTVNINLDMDLIADSYWDILAKIYDEERHKSNYLFQEIHMALEKHFPLSHSREKLKTLLKFIRDYWVEAEVLGSDTNNFHTEPSQMVLPLMITPKIIKRLYIGLQNLITISEDTNQLTGLQSLFNKESPQDMPFSDLQSAHFISDSIYKQVVESLNFTSSFSNILLLLMRRFKVFKTTVIGDVISASSEHIIPGEEMIVKLSFT